MSENESVTGIVEFTWDRGIYPSIPATPPAGMSSVYIVGPGVDRWFSYEDAFAFINASNRTQRDASDASP